MIWSVGIVGCGRMGERHARAYAAHPGFRLAAAMDPDPGRLDLFGTQWKIPARCRTMEELLSAARLDVVSLCSPTEFHFGQAEHLLRSPRRPRLLFIEKPVCLRDGELRQLRELAAQAGVQVAVNHTRRFDPAHRRLAEWTRAGKLGRLLEGNCSYYGGWINNGTHWVDLVRMLFPEEPQIAASAEAPTGRGKDRDLHVELRVGPAPVHLKPFDEAHYQLFEAEFRFEKGRVWILDFGKQVHLEEVRLNRREERVLAPIEGSPWEGLAASLPSAAAAVAAALEGKEELTRLGADLSTVAETMKLVWAAQEAAVYHHA